MSSIRNVLKRRSNPRSSSSSSSSGPPPAGAGETNKGELQAVSDELARAAAAIAKVEAKLEIVQGKLDDYVKDWNAFDADEKADYDNKRKNYHATLQAEKTALQAEKTALQAEKTALQAEKTALQQKEAALQAEKTALQQKEVLLLEEKSERRKRSAWEWLKGPEPVMEWVIGPSPSQKSRNSTEVPVFYAPDFVEPWPAFGSEVPETLTGTMLTALQGDPMYNELHFSAAHEKEIEEAMVKIKDRVERVASKCFLMGFKTSFTKVFDPVGVTYREFDHAITTEDGPVLVIEDKTPTAFPSKDVGAYWRNTERGDGGTVACPVTQLCMYLRLCNLKYGMLTTYDTTWFVCLVADDSGRHGIRVTPGFSTTEDYRGQNPRGMSLSQALLLAISLALSDDGALSEDEWKPFAAEVKVVQSAYQAKHQEAASEEQQKQQKTTQPTRKSSRSMQRGGGEYDSLPLATVSAVLDMAPNKVVPILGGAGAGFKKQHVHGYKSFIKLLSPALVDPDDVNELKHEAEMYQLLEPLWGSSVPGLVYHGELERGKFALITTDEGESLATEEGFRLAQNGQDLLRLRAHEALSLVHDKGVLHGDVALRNIVVDSKCNVKVIDFGRATLVDPKDPKVQQAFAIEHAQLDADFSKYGIDVSGAESPPAIHYGEQKRPRSSEGMYKEQQQVHARKTALAPMEM